MIITLVKDDPKHNPSGKRWCSPRCSLKGNPRSIRSSSNLPHSRKAHHLPIWYLSPPCQKPVTKPAPQQRKMRRAQQSRRPQPYAPNVLGIHLRKIKHLVTKLYASMLSDCGGAPENELTLFLTCFLYYG